MPVSWNTSDNDRSVHITVSGRFDFRLSQDFRDSYRLATGQEGVTYHVDLHEISYLDRSALGMLLLLREYAKSRGGVVIIDYPSEDTGRVLKNARFDHLFTINTDRVPAATPCCKAI
jgi:anti-anti-sigma factor